MRHSLIILTIISTIFIVGGLLIFKKTNFSDRILGRTQINDTSILRAEILKSIKNPFAKSDTIIIETIWKVCGNSTEEELPIAIDTKLEEQISIDRLSKNLGQTVMTMESFHKVMDTTLKYHFHNDYPTSLWDSCRINKVYATILTEKSKENSNILVHEQFQLNDTVRTFEKEFYTYNGKWAYKFNQSTVDTIKSGR